MTVGSKDLNPPPDIIIDGVSADKEFARFEMLPNGLILIIVDEKDEIAKASILVNGEPLKDNGWQILHHLDTI